MNEMFDILDENGEYTGKVASREECHEKGLTHKAVVVFVINSNNEILLQQRSANKKTWPNLWDITAGGHVLTREFGYQAVIRETKEEIGLDIDEKDLIFIGCVKSEVQKGDIIDRHFNEYFIVNKDVDVENLTLQSEEVQDIRWFSIKELVDKINNNYEGLTTKLGLWEYLKKYFEFNNML